jgi:hypothetical protein
MLGRMLSFVLTAVALATEIAATWPTTQSDGDRLRLVRQYVMDLERATDPGALMVDPPGSTGDQRWDALIAGVVEDFAVRNAIANPRWTVDPARRLETWWFVTSIPALRPTAFVNTPAALSARGVFLQRASLVNV